MKTYQKNTTLLAAAINVLEEEHPCTLRQLFYRLVSAGELPNAQTAYQRLGKLMTRARESGLVDRRHIVDHVRATMKPGSWSGLQDFGDTVRNAYRKDFWASLDHYVAVFVEKDAVAGTIQPVTYEHNVSLHVCRGYASVSFVGEIADDWSLIEKPIHAYYLGDFDPSGFDIERDLKEKLSRYSDKSVYETDQYHVSDRNHIWWTRLGVLPTDFAEFDLIRLPIKSKDSRASGFRENYGDAGAEIDAIPPTELRRRVTDAISNHIDVERWNSLLQVEAAERATMRTVLASLGTETESRSHLAEGEGSA